MPVKIVVVKKYLVVSCLILLISLTCYSQNLSEKYLSGKTVTWQECISFYRQLDAKYNEAKLFEEGLTDVGKPLHVFVLSSDMDFNPQSIHKKSKCVLLINNGIHPGEPDGIDASMKFALSVLSDPEKKKILNHLVICIIPIYNIDGALNRSCCSRANQDGPEEYGFRGNARNLDLNRDFIKSDAENTKSFAKIFHKWNPDLFVDTHVSDGADYQYTLTLIATQKNKIASALGDFINSEMVPALYSDLKKAGTETCPYVEPFHKTPDDGLTGFLETPRFASGYAALFNTIGFITETHMLKPFKNRVEATLNFLNVLCNYANNNSEKIISKRAEAVNECLSKIDFDLNWKLDTSTFKEINFKGYEAKYKPSNVTGLQRLYYDRQLPYEKTVRFYNSYKSSVQALKPQAYIIPQAWQEAINLLKLNKVELKRLDKDTMIAVYAYFIEDFKTTRNPYEGHYLHYDVKVKKEIQEINLFKGDYIVYTNQNCNRYIVETLEPQGVDSYFAWGLFDAVLQQKEWFSDYVFEEKAEEILKKNPKLKQQMEQKQKSDTSFAANSWGQLEFVYKNSEWFEKSYRRYPVYRIEY